jgi:hypothetical protein
MKQLKHIKLFEAFESVKLGKTLSFINSSAKSTFIDNLKRIAKNYDFPISKFNDDMFQYLPFKSALRKNVDPPKPTEREVCKRESDWIPGEFCQGALGYSYPFPSIPWTRRLGVTDETRPYMRSTCRTQVGG